MKPVSREDLLIKVRHALERRHLLRFPEVKSKGSPPELSNPEDFKAIVDASSKVRRVLKEAEFHAQSDMPVLITGESGTGKGLPATAIHRASFPGAYPCRVGFGTHPYTIQMAPGGLIELKARNLF